MCGLCVPAIFIYYFIYWKLFFFAVQFSIDLEITAYSNITPFASAVKAKQKKPHYFTRLQHHFQLITQRGHIVIQKLFGHCYSVFNAHSEYMFCIFVFGLFFLLFFLSFRFRCVMCRLWWAAENETDEKANSDDGVDGSRKKKSIRRNLSVFNRKLTNL